MPDEKMLIKSMLLLDIDRIKSVLSSKIDDIYVKHDVSVSIFKTELLDLISYVHFDVNDLIDVINKWGKK